MAMKALAYVWVICVGAAPVAADDDTSQPAPTAVTGSWIEGETRTRPAPLTVLRRDELDAAGRSMLGDILQQQIAQSSAINAQSNDGKTVRRGSTFAVWVAAGR